MDLGLRIFTLLIWISCLYWYFRGVKQFPPDERFERVTYSGVILAYIFHVIVFYIFVILNRANLYHLPGINFNSWSNALRIHGGLSIMIKEILHVLRIWESKK